MLCSKNDGNKNLLMQSILFDGAILWDYINNLLSKSKSEKLSKFVKNFNKLKSKKHLSFFMSDK